MRDPDPHPEAGQGVAITVVILDSSSAQLAVADGELTGGSWSGSPPKPGAIIAPGQTTYVNTGQSTFSQVGGYVTLTPAGGGSILMSWSWTSGEGLSVYGNVSGTNALLLNYSATNVSTFHPTVTYTITQPGAARDRR